MYRSKFNSRKHSTQPPKKQNLSRNQKHNGTNSHLPASLMKTLYLLPAMQNWCYLHFFSTNKVTSPALIFIGADLKSTNSPQRFFHLKINLLHRLQSSQKTWFSSLWQIQLPPDIWYIPSPMISAFSIGGHHVPQCKGLIQNTNVRSTGWATVFLGIFWLYQPENTVKYTQYKDWKHFWPYSES